MANANIKVNVNKQEIDEWADYEEVKNNEGTTGETKVNLSLEMNDHGNKTFHCENCGCDDIKRYFVFCPICGKMIKFYRNK